MTADAGLRPHASFGMAQVLERACPSGSVVGCYANNGQALWLWSTLVVIVLGKVKSAQSYNEVSGGRRSGGDVAVGIDFPAQDKLSTGLRMSSLRCFRSASSSFRSQLVLRVFHHQVCLRHRLIFAARMMQELLLSYFLQRLVVTSFGGWYSILLSRCLPLSFAFATLPPSSLPFLFARALHI